MSALISKLIEALDSLKAVNAEARLPQRIRVSIMRNDDLSEVLVRMIQLIVFALWGFFYAITPVPDPDTTSSVPLIISIYLIFTFLQLLFAAARRLPDWLVYTSIIVDMALLGYLIWSFHVQYGQPASFSLKAVEVMNFFVLIGLRALRFEARYVLAAGLAACVSWSLLVIYAIRTDPTDPMITRDYVTYLTSNSVLIGAEISKLISMVMFTIVLAIAVRRAHQFLVSSVTEESAAQELSRFMPGSVAEQIRDADHQIKAGEGVRREAAVVNVDIRGFSIMVAQMDPGQAMHLLSDYQHQIVPIVHRHKGVVDKFMGDGIMITFGASSSDHEYCANALRCINEILERQPQWDGPSADVPVNLSAAAGPVVYGAVGDGDRLEYTVIGPTVNHSAKLEKHNKILKTKAICDRKLFKLALKQGYKPDRETRQVETAVGDDVTPTHVVVLA